ncbi:contact-dependent growth inhibition system immunity protein [Parasphingorhabdus sp.]|uniref:contact-dependent growth inhibition system immunity protein n=1 Tax=Parasphingorhabdus sp. TaxID=2709688 RepID=UPI00359345CA
MVGRRSNQMLREDMERRFYRLGQFLGGYLHEDWPKLYGTPEIALGKAMEESPIELRQQARRELTRVLAEFEEDKKLREVLNSGLGVNVFFKKPRVRTY